MNDHNVELRKLPDDVLAEFKRITKELLVEMTQEDESSKKIYESLSNFPPAPILVITTSKAETPSFL